MNKEDKKAGGGNSSPADEFYDNGDTEMWEIDEDLPESSRQLGFAGKLTVLLLLLAFISFSFPNFSSLFVNQFDFLKQNQALKSDDLVVVSRAAVVGIEAVPINQRAQEVKIGSGFNLSGDGLVMTNHHVVADCRQVKINFSDEETYISRDIKSFVDLDIALISFDAQDLPALAIEDSRPVKSGEEVTVIGNPLGFQGVSVRGNVGKHYRQTADGFPYFDIAVEIEQGSSGSPVINNDGNVVGIVFAVAQITSEDGEKPEQRALAIPLQGLKETIYNTEKE